MARKMPGLDGIETVKKLQEAHDQELPAIMMVTAHNRLDAERRSADAPVSVFLDKPVSEELMKDSLLDVLGILSVERTKNANLMPDRLEFYKHTPWKVLLVEDNEVNQQIMLELLNDLHFHTDTAMDGEAAVRRALEERYDLILMDVQMPKLDGYEATREIRKSYNSTQLPIIAMTAYALDQDKQRAIDSGMNAHIAKPIDETELMNALRSQLKLENVDSIDSGATNTGAEWLDRLGAIDRNEIPGNLATRPETFQSILRTAYSNHRDDMSLLVDALIKEDIEEAKAIAHTLKGMSGNIGAKLFNQDVSSLYASLGTGDYGEHLANAKESYEALMNDLENLSSPIQSETTKNLDEAIQDLRERLQNQGHDAYKYLSVLQRLIGSEQLPTYDKLEVAVQRYQFKEALLLLEKLTQEIQ